MTTALKYHYEEYAKELVMIAAWSCAQNAKK